MKLNKQITTLLLTAALLTSSLTACDTAKADKDDTRGTTTDTTDTSTETTESETSAEKNPVRLSPNFHNGVWGNSNVTYTFNQNGELSVHIADWDESHLFTSLADENIAFPNTSLHLLA